MNRGGISFAGAGRVASSLCRKLYQCGNNIDLIVSETGNSCRSLADSCKARWSIQPDFPETTSVIIVSVPDHRLKSVLYTLKCSSETLVVHTAGSFGLGVFPDHIVKRGVFYPLQTFSYNRQIAFRNLPFLIESADDSTYLTLKKLVESMGSTAYASDEGNRKMLHVAAVFTCNFTNHMLTIGKELSERAGFSYEIMKPLIIETISKAAENGPEKSQTGPAVRNDLNTIEKHLDLLSFSPELKSLYIEMTKSIRDYHNKE